MSDNIDDVAASFAASLALAGGEMLDVSRRSGVAQKKKAVFYLLVKPLTLKQVDPSDLHQTFKQIWTLTAKFRVQSKPNGLFLFSFDLRKDRNRVLWGGPWYYFRAPMVIMEYDGLLDFEDVKMDSLFFWVRIEKIPPKLELPEIIEDAAIVAGDNPHVDKELLELKGEVRVRVSHALDRPFIFEKVLKLSPTVIKNVLFSYENLYGLCDVCKLVYHADGVCKLKKNTEKVMLSNDTKVVSLVDMLNPSQGSMVFSGAKPVASGAKLGTSAPFSSSPVHVVMRKPVVQRKPDSLTTNVSMEKSVLGPVDTNVQGIVAGDGVEKDMPDAAVVVLPDESVVLLPDESMVEADQDKENAAPLPDDPKHISNQSKRPRSPQDGAAVLVTEAVYTRAKDKKSRALVQFGAATLGMMNGPNGCLVLKEAVDTKKRGRTLGSKNRKPTKAQLAAASELEEREKAGQVVLQYLLNGKPQDPSVKGKDIVPV